MTTKRIVVGFVCLSFLIFAPFAEADLIVDTGTPNGDFGYGLSSSTWRAAMFYVPEPGCTITGIEGYMDPNVFGQTVDTVDIGVYITADSGYDLPDFVAQTLYSGSLSLGASDPESWYGVNGLTLGLAGDAYYWVVFGPTGSGLAAMRAGAPNPVDHAAFSTDLGETWGYTDQREFGVRVYCNPVPEPATMLLLGTGLVGLVGFRKKFKK